jgi:NADPH2:quinone reductase
MKAALVNNYGKLEDIEVADVQPRKPERNEVLIDVKYAGVNFPDVLITKGLYQFKPEVPFSPGGEVAGIVTSVGPDVTFPKIGDRVLAAAGWGGFAEQAIFPASNCFLLPDEVPFREASVLLETYATAYHALVDRATLQAKERVVVLGAAGGTGIATVQLAKTLGAEVIAVAGSKEKLDFCAENGADHSINYMDQDLKAELKSLGGCDIVFDPVGGAASEAAFRSLKPGGRHLVVGFASGEIPSLPWNLPLLKSASIVGVFWGGFWRNFPEKNRANVDILLDWLSKGKIKPQITKEYPLDHIKNALLDIDQRRAIGKIAIKM